MKPAPRIEQRLLRQSFEEVAREENRDRLEVENDYSLARTALVHFHANDFYGVWPLDAVDDLLKTGAEFMRLARKTKYWPEARIDALDKIGKKLLDVARAGAAEYAVTPEHLRTFIAVVEEAYRQFRASNYEVDGIVRPEVLLLAHMMRENFPAYEARLNYTLPAEYPSQ